MRRDGNASVETICIDIYIGLKEGYDGKQWSIDHLEEELQHVCDKGLCVSVIPCRYIYKDGNEDGAIVRLINYPRFPSTLIEIKSKAIYIANKLKERFKQYRVSIQAPDMTYMIGT